MMTTEKATQLISNILSELTRDIDEDRKREQAKTKSLSCVNYGLRNDLANATLALQERDAEITRYVEQIQILKGQLDDVKAGMPVYGHRSMDDMNPFQEGDDSDARSTRARLHLRNQELIEENSRLQRRYEELAEKHEYDQVEVAIGRNSQARIYNLETQVAMLEARLATYKNDDPGLRVDADSIVLLDGWQPSDPKAKEALDRLRKEMIFCNNLAAHTGKLWSRAIDAEAALAEAKEELAKYAKDASGSEWVLGFLSDRKDDANLEVVSGPADVSGFRRQNWRLSFNSSVSLRRREVYGLSLADLHKSLNVVLLEEMEDPTRS